MPSFRLCSMFAPAAVLFLVACGPAAPESSCGAGTEERAGVCVALAVDAGPGVVCGAGTVEQDSKCVPDETKARRCGAGTHEAEGVCLPDSTLSCAGGTHEESGACVPDSTLTCAAGTHEVDGACVPDSTLTCAEGTHEAEGACVPDSTLTCAEGTHEVDGACVPDSTLSCGDGTHEENGACVPDPGVDCGSGTHLEGMECLAGDPIDAIAIAPDARTIRVNQQTQLTASASFGGAAVAGVAFTWRVTPETIATITQDGVVTALAEGTALVTASARGVTSAPATLTVEPGPPFVLTQLDPLSGPNGSPVVIKGSGFGAAQGATKVLFGATPATTVLSWSDTQVVVRVPGGLPGGAAQVGLSLDGSASNTLPFTVTTAPYVVEVTPRHIAQRTLATLRVRGFNLSGVTTISGNKGSSADAQFKVDLASLLVEPGAAGTPDTVTVKLEVTDVAEPGRRTIVLGTSGGTSQTAATPDNAVLLTIERGNIETVVGNGLQGTSGNGGKATSANLNAPGGLWFHNGLLFVADTGNNCVRAVNRTDEPRTLGALTVAPETIQRIAGTCGQTGGAGDGGPALDATFSTPRGLLVVPGTTLLVVADSGNHKLRVVNFGAAAQTWGKTTVASGSIATLAGNGTAGWGGDDGDYDAAGVRFNGPSALAYDAGRKLLFVADTLNHRVRALNATSETIAVSGGSIPGHGLGLVAGNGSPGADGDGGFALLAKLNAPQGLALDARGVLYVADTNGNRIRAVNTMEDEVTIAGIAGQTGITIAAGNIVTAAGTGVSGTPSAGATSTVQMPMKSPMGLAVEPIGVLYSAGQVDAFVLANNLADGPARRGLAMAANLVPQSWSRGIAGSVAGFGGDHGLATLAKLSGPRALALDLDGGSLYIADSDNNRVRRLLVQWPSRPFSGELGPFPALGAGTAKLDSDTGVLTPATSGAATIHTGVRSGVFAFSSINVPASLTLELVGDNPVVLAASGTLSLEGTIAVPAAGIVPGAAYAGPAFGSGYCGQASGVGAHGSGTGTAKAFGPLLVPLSGGGGGSSTGIYASGGGAVGLMAQGAVTLAGTVDVRGHGVSVKCWSNPVQYASAYGAGGGIRVTSQTSIVASGTLDARNGGGQSNAGRIRLESPSVVTAGSSITPAPVTSATLGPVPGL